MLSPWESRSFHRPPQIAVIGGGLVGLFTALFHKRTHPHHHVVVLEKGQFPSGASVKNAGFACFGSPSELIADIDAEGMDAAMARVEMRWRGLHELRQELGDEALRYEANGGHEIFRSDDPLYTQVQERFDELNAALSPIVGPQAYRWDDRFIQDHGLGGIAHLARTDHEGSLNSGAMMQTLLQKAMNEGVQFRSNSHVTAIEEDNLKVKLTFNDTTQVIAEQVVVATNGYTSEVLPQLDVIPGRGQVILTTRIEGLRLKGNFHYRSGFYYFRDLEGCVLLGGGRDLDLAGETTTQEGSSPVIQNELERLLREMILPDHKFTIQQRWSGIMGFGSRSKTPLVERISDRIVTAVRLGGMGVAIGIQVARKAAALLK